MEKANALYKYTNPLIFHISFKIDTRTFNEANCGNGKVPGKIIIHFARNESFPGSYTFNAFNMRHYDIES